MAEPVHPVDEVLPLPKLFALGLQHVLVMYANAVAVPLIIGGALHLNAVEYLLSDKARNVTGTVLTIDSGATA